MKGFRADHLFLNIFVISIAFATIARCDDQDCVYTVYTKTGWIIKAGTDSTISLTLYDKSGYNFLINNLVAWGGLMGPDYNYFEWGNLDIFSGRGQCLPGPVCKMNLTSDGLGSHHGWYCEFVEVTATGVNMPCSKQLFTVEQWLAKDAPPYELTAIRDNCEAEGGLRSFGKIKKNRTESSAVSEI